MTMREMMARAMCIASGISDPDAECTNMPMASYPTSAGIIHVLPHQGYRIPAWCMFLNQANAALDALLEPTEGMIWAGIVPLEKLETAAEVSETARDEAVRLLAEETGRDMIASFYIFHAMIHAAQQEK